MLYITTRDRHDVCTANHTVHKDWSDNGGLFVPFQDLTYTEEQIRELQDKTFGQCVAQVLNQFFSARLDGWDVDFCVGRYPVKMVPMSHKIIIAETWHNPDWDFARLVRNLCGRLRGAEDSSRAPSNWIWIAVRIAVLFGIYGELLRLGMTDTGKKLDISVTAGDFSAPIAAWYARAMGLPIGMIIFSCNENSAAWDLLHHGQLRTNAPIVATTTPACDCNIPVNLERLISAVLGTDEAVRYSRAIEKRVPYEVDDEQRLQLREGMFGAVISKRRLDSVICNVYRTSTYLLGPYSGLAYGALQDYRARTGETGTALILSEQSPVCSAEVVAGAMGISVSELKDRIVAG